MADGLMDHRDPAVLDVLLRNDLALFVQAGFAELHPDVRLQWAPYLDLICAKLAEVVFEGGRKLIITVPPRSLKSICVSVALPAFFLGHRPAGKIMVVSYGAALARELGEQTRRWMRSDLYRRLFDTQLAAKGQTATLLTTTASGVRRATSIDGVATGVGADLLIFDDPQKQGETVSEAIRRTTNAAYGETFHSRLNDPATASQVIVMQRLHEDDFVGHVLATTEGWEVINLPAIAEADEEIRYKTALGPAVFRRREAEALNPGRVSLDDLEAIRRSVGEALFAAQYQQRPAPAGGGIVNTAWFRFCSIADFPANPDQTIQSWDTAQTMAQWSDYSVCITIDVVGQNRYIRDVFRARLVYPFLKRAVVERARMFGATTVVIEQKNAGQCLVQDLRGDNFGPVQSYEPRGDKPMRMTGQTHWIEGGYVYLPKDATWVPEFMHEMAMFPNGKYDDQVDALSQALDFLGNPRIKGWAYLENARRELAEWRARGEALSDEVEWVSGPNAKMHYAKGSMEWQAEQQARKARGEAFEEWE